MSPGQGMMAYFSLSGPNLHGEHVQEQWAFDTLHTSKLVSRQTMGTWMHLFLGRLELAIRSKFTILYRGSVHSQLLKEKATKIPFSLYCNVVIAVKLSRGEEGRGRSNLGVKERRLRMGWGQVSTTR